MCHHASRYSKCMSGWTITLLYCGNCQCASMTNTSTLHFTWQRIDSRSETVDIQYYATVGWPDRCCFLHTSPTHTTHPYHLSSTAQQQVWLSSQTIRTIHITTHDRHKLSRPHWLTAYSNVPGELPGCQLRYQEKLQTQPMFSKVLM